METIKGRKHVWCGRVNWDGNDVCTCPAWAHWDREMKAKHPGVNDFVDVVLDKPTIISLGKTAARLIRAMNMRVSIGYDLETENEAGDVVGALILDGWVLIYPEPKVNETLDGYASTMGYAIDIERVFHGGREEPDDIDYARVGYNTNEWTAISKALTILFENQLNYTIEGLAMEDDAKRQEKEVEEWMNLPA
jgi:hypothetical protein